MLRNEHFTLMLRNVFFGIAVFEESTQIRPQEATSITDIFNNQIYVLSASSIHLLTVSPAKLPHSIQTHRPALLNT